MQLVLIAMTNNTGTDQEYLDRSQLVALLKDFADIEEGIPERYSGSSPYRVHGAGAG